MDVLILGWLLWASVSPAAEVVTNAVHMADAPTWLKRTRVERVVDRVQTALEWTVRRTEVFWYTDQVKFQAAHNLGPFAMSVTRGRDVTVHLGPKVTDANFDVTFAHELTHVILRQKYRDAVPKWLEEGLANHLAKGPPVDYGWLAKQAVPGDVRTLSHPYAEPTAEAVRLRYVASEALLEMIARKCDLTNLLRLSVENGMESYLSTYCEINDLNSAYKRWVKSKAG